MQCHSFCNNLSANWRVRDGGNKNLKTEDWMMIPGNPLRVVLSPSSPYEDLYAYLELGAHIPSTVLYELAVAFPSQYDRTACQAFEFEFHCVSKGVLWNGGIQAAFRETDTWRVYDFGNAAWVDTKVKLPLAAEWVSGINIVALYRITGSAVVFDGLQLQHTWTPLGVSMPTQKTSDHDKFNMAFQLDGDGKKTPYAVLLRTADVRILY